MTSTERKRLQRQRDRAAGWTEVNLRVASDQVEALRAFAATLSPPLPPTDPRQLSLLDEIDRQLCGDTTNKENEGQGFLGL
uniref:Uncharacterized protein n=1 Tax=uncultured prokaryote TaxID=198431 RepID=A0A0H5QL08_9ZZZZ|nr:hypothetical protein [uncultured prokaryote]